MRTFEPTKIAIEAAPAAAVVTAPFVGVTISDIAALLGCLFLLMQIAYLVWRWRRDIKREKEGHEIGDSDGD